MSLTLSNHTVSVTLLGGLPVCYSVLRFLLTDLTRRFVARARFVHARRRAPTHPLTLKPHAAQQTKPTICSASLLSVLLPSRPPRRPRRKHALLSACRFLSIRRPAKPPVSALCGLPLTSPLLTSPASRAISTRRVTRGCVPTTRTLPSTPKTPGEFRYPWRGRGRCCWLLHLEPAAVVIL